MRLPRRVLHAIAAIRPEKGNLPTLVRLGSDYGAHVIADEGLGPNSVVVSFGVGEDVSFDLAMIERFGVVVHAFDPTPRSIAWVAGRDLPPKFRMNPIGVGVIDGEASFAPPDSPDHVSHRMVAENGTVRFPIRRLDTILRERGLARVDVLKMDIEGAELDVLDDMLDGPLRPTQVLVEFHPQLGLGFALRTRRVARRMTRAGYRVAAVSPTGREVTFLRGAGTA